MSHIRIHFGTIVARGEGGGIPKSCIVLQTPENEGGGSKAVWNFSENSSVLVGLGFPYNDKIML